MTEETTELTLSREAAAAFELALRHAKMYAASTLVPVSYQGEGNVANVMIAVNMAKRIGCDPLQVMQSLHVVNGKPGWSSQFLIACFNTCGRYAPISYRFNQDKTACRACSKILATGEEIEGTAVSIEMAKAEGWYQKKGSKWQTMPEQMLRYRAAAFLIRATAPELGLGMYTKSELEDITSE